MPDISTFVSVSAVVAAAPAAKFSFASYMGVFTHAITANRKDGPYTSVAEVDAAGFTSGAAAAINAWATTVFAQDNGVDSVIIGREDAGDASATAALTAIEADPSQLQGYFLTYEGRDDTNIAAVAAWAEARRVIYIGQSDDKVAVAMAAAQAAGYNRTAIIYHDDDSEYLDGAWTSAGGGLNLDAPDGAGIWAFLQLSGVTGAGLTTAESDAIYAEDGNIFDTTKGYTFTSKGTMASGRHIDVTTSVDWFEVRAEEALLARLVTAAPKVPYTDAGINILRADIEGVGAQGVAFGHISPGSFVLDPLTLADISTADKAAREITFTGSFVLSGAIQKVTFNLTVEL